MTPMMQVLTCLQDYGPMTGAEISEMTGMSRFLTSATVGKMVKALPKRPQRIHIKKWVEDHFKQRRYPRAVYAIGPGPNAPKPKADQNARKREYYARKKAILKNSSIFNLAVPLKCLRSRSTPGTKIENSVKSANTSKRNPESTTPTAQTR